MPTPARRKITLLLWTGLLTALLAPTSAAENPGSKSGLEVIHPILPVVVSTVSPSITERINKQIPPNKDYVVTDATLEKSAVGSGYSVLPLPAFVYNRNEGAWVGGLMPVFRANTKGQVEDIFAPLYLHNNLVGETFTLNYFGYRSATKQYHVIVSHATKVERTIDLSYKDIGYDDGRYIVSLQANSGKSAFNRFYGFGNQSLEQSESNYAMGDANLVVSGGINISETLSIVGSERLRRVSIGNGVVSSLPQTKAAFPTAPGIDGARIWGQGATVSYDTRDNPLTTLTGTYAALTGEFDQNYKADNRDQWWRTTGEVRNYLPHDGDRAVFVSRAMFDFLPIDSKGLVPQGVPFYERPTLGGENTLRGFGDGRFVSSFALLFNVEERFAVMQRSVLGNVLELNIAPFLDFGRVGRTLGSNGVVDNMQFNPGIGFRLLARPNIASRLDVAYGHDGANVYVGLDYPF